MRQRFRTLSGRDQAVSSFGAILLRLCDGIDAAGTALVDSEGETVDYAGVVNPFEIRVAAAEWQLVLKLLRKSVIPDFRTTHELFVRCSQKSFAAFALGEGYCIVAELLPNCFSVSQRALGEAVRELSDEAGLLIPESFRPFQRWTRVEVQTSASADRRPISVWMAGAWCPIEVLGRYHAEDLERNEVGYRGRLVTGAEVTFVREALGRWYAEDMPRFG